MIYKCANPTRHPTLHVLEGHHQPPKAYRAKLLAADPNVDQSWWRVVDICATDHSEIHTLLNAYVHSLHGHPIADLNTYSKYVRALAAEAWEHRPSDKPPYTDV